jgi:5-methylcytosine-specific restriction enzyme subunit McrC
MALPERTSPTMAPIDLQEHQPADVELTPAQLAALHRHRADLGITIEPTGNGTTWRLTPGSTVGALDIGDLSVAIRPKLDVGRVLFLASYALGEFKLRDLEVFHFSEQRPPLETMILLFADAVRRAFSRGLLHGYRTEEEALTTVRGRIRFADQIGRRLGIPLPAEVRYDDFTEDILANRLVKAATHALGTIRLRDPDSRRKLARVWATLDNVALVKFPRNDLPEVTFDRRNEHYRQAIALSRLVLQYATVETGRGPVQAAGFLMDMNQVFERFVRSALREKLGLSKRVFRDRSRTVLDVANRIRLDPDLSWWKRGRCVFVGDAKYKRIDNRHAPNADLYQLLAYTTALDLPGGVLVYAKGERDPAIHKVRHAGKRLEVFALDLAGEPTAILEQISELADRVRTLAANAPAARAA